MTDREMMSATPAPARSVEDVVALLRLDGTSPSPDGQAGASDGGGTVPASFTGLDHGLQCADHLRRERPDDIELQVAGLVHDLGHRLAPRAPERHGSVGGGWVAGLFGPRVGALVELHVDAKRYLVAVEPGYRDQLSMGSAETLIAQGEAMDPAEAEAFARRDHAADAVVLRRADEAAKEPGRAVPGLEEWVPLMEALATSQRGSAPATNA